MVFVWLTLNYLTIKLYKSAILGVALNMGEFKPVLKNKSL
jgi:hypothetical protein